MYRHARNMYLTRPFFFFSFFLPRLVFLITAASYYAVDDIAINCGSSGNTVALDGRQWVGDVGSQFMFPRRTKSKSISSTGNPASVFANFVPYLTARISTTEFTYTFRVSAGQKFIRLHFHPASYPGFERSKATFTVKAGPYTLLSNFSASLVADALGKSYFAKEFCLNIEQDQVLSITFSPSTGSTSAEAYVLVNGIEIVSMPAGLYYTPDGDPGALVVGQRHRFHIDNSTALELIQRVNIGGSSILPRDDGSAFRLWSGDINYWLEPGISPITTATKIRYINTPSYVAPQRVYQTARSVEPNQMHNLTRKVLVDLGFRYLIRLHFCELDEAVKGRGQREFNIFVNNKSADTQADLFEWSGGSGVAVHRDYVVMMEGDRREGKRNLVVALEPLSHESWIEHDAGAILNGLEVFKLSNPDNNLSGQNPEPPAPLPLSTSPKLGKLLLLVFGNWNVAVSGVIVLITLLNIILYKLRLRAEKLGKKNISSLSSSTLDESCRRFSLADILLATNNFDEALVIGDGGFGQVYKGVIDKGAIPVAVKRLKSMSKQGADEFWTEIKTLSKLHHPHLVTLIGYCDDSQEMILIYEYMVNGTLADHLYKISRTIADHLHKPLGIGPIAPSPLSWEQRLNICIGAARGLEYLHAGAQHRIIHRDVKTSNILLDDSWVAKISDFGLSKMSGTANQSSITDVKGTFGYLDVEYFLTHRLTRKSDVYAFGVVLFEVLCGRPAIDKSFEGEQRSLALWAQRCIKEGKVDQIIDPSLKGQISSHCLKVFAEVAFKCLHSRPNERPRMADVVQRLEFALLSQDQNAYSSTDTDEDEADAIRNDICSIGNRKIDPMTEGEEDNDYSGVDEILKQNGAQGSTGSPISLQDGMPNTPKAKTHKKTYSRVIDGIAKSMDLRGRKPKANGSSNSQAVQANSSSRTTWWRQRTRSFGDAKPSSVLLERPCRRFSLAEMRAATKNFHRNLIIKYGGPGGEMYRGYIDNGDLQVAIERCTRATKTKFLEEVEMRSQLHHRHLVPFIGYCKDEDEMILVYQYMVKGNLSNHLHGTGNDPLPWKKRLEICIGAAQGLRYLHSDLQNPIIHGDLKSSSILLDEKWIAKISGLELSKVDVNNFDANNKTRTIVTTVVMATMGYMDPDYLLSGHLTKESDVYSFGVVLLEVLCAREPLIPHLNRDQKNLVHWFKSSMQKREIDRIIDPHMMGKIAPKCLRVFVRIVEWCLHFRAVDRPSMDDVMRRLQTALQMQEEPGDHIEFGVPENSSEKYRAAVARAYQKVL